MRCTISPFRRAHALCDFSRGGAEAQREKILCVSATLRELLLLTGAMFPLLLPVCQHACSSPDWTTFRADPQRSGISAAKVETPLSLTWVFEPTHAPSPAWPVPAEERPRAHADAAYQVAIGDGIVFLGTSADDRVFALDRQTGRILWSFFAEGPVRFAPTFWEGKVYFGSDDGFVYCLEKSSGEVVWKVRAGPTGEKAIGNGRMVSMWPVRTSVLVDDGIVYFGAGVFPHEGVYITALDARDGSALWKNDTVGDLAHELDYGGISPQGYLVASESTLYVPSGRAMPAAFDKKTGKFIRWCSSDGKVGGTWALVEGNRLIAGVDRTGEPAKVAFDANTGNREGDVFASFPGLDMVVTPEVSYTLTERGLVAIDRQAYRDRDERLREIAAQRDKLRERRSELGWELGEAKGEKRKKLVDDLAEIAQSLTELSAKEKELSVNTVKWSLDRKGLNCLVLAGESLFVGGEGETVALDVSNGSPVWEGKIDGVALGLAVADGSLFVSTDRGPVYCFQEGKGREVVRIPPPLFPETESDREKESGHELVAEALLKESGVSNGFCLVFGYGDGHLAEEIAERSTLSVVDLEPDRAKAAAARERLCAKGLYGSRVVIEPWDASDLPDYFANLIVYQETPSRSENSPSPEDLGRILRPCGGVAVFRGPDGSNENSDWKDLAERVAVTCGTQPAVFEADGEWMKVTRGPLEGAGEWTSLYGNPQNTACSNDNLVSSPLGLLWYGEPGPRGMVERHARASSPLSLDGRLFVQGENLIMAYDAYNGAFLWERPIPGAVRVRVDVDGGNLAASSTGVYVAAYDKCYRLDPATGETLRTYDLPAAAGDTPRRWGYIACAGDLLLGSRALALEAVYQVFWEKLTSEGRWKEIEEIPEEDRDVWRAYLDEIRERYPTPSQEAWEDFHRSGSFWFPMHRFPAWDSQESPEGAATDRMMTGDMLFALDANTGEVRWIHKGNRIAHIAVTIGEGKVFLADRSITAEQRERALQDRKDGIQKDSYEESVEADLKTEDLDIRMLRCLDLASGDTVWESPVDFTGCGGDKMGLAYQDVNGRGFLASFGHFSNHDRGFFNSGTLRWRRIHVLDAKTGEMVWSKPLNYLRRPVVVRDTIVIEPRSVNLVTGEITTRHHPITNREVPFEFLRPGHSCGITTASLNNIFYRSYCVATYDLAQDSGMELFGAIRPGCWINTISANGLLLFPEASSGCTCSFPVRCSVALKPKAKETPTDWTVFISEGPVAGADRLAFNLGAPGDMKDPVDDTLWFGYPRPDTRYGKYGVRFDLRDEVLPGMGYFAHSYRGVEIGRTDKPWLFASGCTGLIRLVLPLVDDLWEEGPGTFTIRLGFAAPAGDVEGQRVFDVKLGAEAVLKDLDVVREAGGPNIAVIKEIQGVVVNNVLSVELTSKMESPSQERAPILNCIEAIREDSTETREEKVTEKGASVESVARTLHLAEEAFARDDLEKALAEYHLAFDAAPTSALRRQALDGMARIGSPQSLGRLASICRDTAPIFRNYEDPDPDLLKTGTSALLAIADNLVERDKGKAIRLFRHTLSLAQTPEVRLEVVGRLDRLGAPIDEEPSRKGYLTRWSLVGPFPWDSETNTLDKTFVNEPQISLEDRYPSTGQELHWESVVNPEARVDLDSRFRPNDRVAVYAYSTFTLPAAQEILVKVGSNDGFKCWLNGLEIGRFDGGRGWQLDQDTFTVQGKEGPNALLVKIFDMGGEWAFSVRLTDSQGNPIRPEYVK